MKQCSKCGETKPLSEFNKFSRSPDGLAYWCRPCHSLYVRNWELDHRDEQKIKRKQYYAKNREREIEEWKKYRKEHLEEVRLKDRERARLKRLLNPIPHREASRRWSEKNKELHRRAARKWAKDNPEKHSANFHRRRARIKGQGGSFTDVEWLWLLKLCGEKCICPCGKHEGTVTKDHIDPFGKNIIDNLQPLCKKCNSEKWQKKIDYRPQWLKDNFQLLKQEQFSI